LLFSRQFFQTPAGAFIWVALLEQDQLLRNRLFRHCEPRVRRSNPETEIEFAAGLLRPQGERLSLTVKVREASQ
jgi:hypothetical protein